MTKQNEKHVYKVAFGGIQKMKVICETPQGYKASPIGQESVWQIWKEKIHKHERGAPEVYYTEKTFLRSDLAFNFAIYLDKSFFL